MAKVSTRSLANICAKHPWRTILIWLLLLALSFFFITQYLGDATTTEFTFTNNPESIRGFDLIDEAFPDESQDVAEEFILVSSPSLSVDDPQFQQFTTAIYQDIIGLGEDVVDKENTAFYYIPANPAFPEELRQSFVSQDRHTTFIIVRMAGDVDQAIDNVDFVHSVINDREPEGDFQIKITGTASINEDVNATAERTLQRAELIGIPIAVLILIAVFGALLAAAIPLILAGIAIILAVGMVAVIGQQWQMSFFVVNMITMMGLAVGIDYALFIISRYREERLRGLSKHDAIVMTGGTASHAVLFSGLTVILALAGLLIVPMSLFRSLAAGAIFVVAWAILATLTLLPAVIDLLGRWVRSKWIHGLFRKVVPRRDGMDSAANVDKKGGFWDWESSMVMRHPVISLLLSAGLLIVLALPALPVDRYGWGIETGQATMDSFPQDLPAIQGFQVIKEKFPFAFTPEVVFVIKGDVQSEQVQQGVANLDQALKADTQSFGEPTKPPEISEDGEVMVLRYPIAYEAVSRQATDRVENLRLQVVPEAFSGSSADVLVTGEAAVNLDYYNTTDSYRWVVIPFVLGLSFILLMVVFRSLVVPLKAIIMNLLSVFASYGLLVLVFQKGYGNEIFSFEQLETVDAWIPLFLFAVLFGLSMDYHVFLLSRIRERYMQTGNNTESVAFGLRTTGGIITGAALIMVAIFAGFAAGDLVMFQQMGFGMGVAVLIDATIIRSVLVPASMRLLGSRNWYLPKWLGWLPELHVEGGGDESIDD